MTLQRLTGLLRRRSLARRLATTYLLTTLGVLVVLGVAVYFVTALYLDRRLEAELSAQADFYAAYAASLASDERALAGLAPTMAGLFAPQADLTVRFFGASNGALLASTQDIGPAPSRLALRELRYRSPTVFTQASRDLPHRRYAARTIPGGERTIGVVEVSRSTLSVENFLATLRTILLGAGLAAGGISLLVSVVVARRLSRPLRQLERATRRIAGGDLTVRVDQGLMTDGPTDEVGRLARSVDHMARQLQRLESARARFISEVSHDLRTPLTAIKGLLVNLIDAAEPAARPSLAVAERETERLIRLVNQLLDFARWRDGRLKLERRPVAVGPIAADAVALCQARAHHRRIALSAQVAPDLPPISADGDRLERVMLNLLDNALRFTPGGGTVTLSVARRGAAVEVSVRDTGRGMTAQEREKAFQPYYRGADGGAGLGLAIARAIVEAHGGRMAIESEVGQGSRVWFSLPV